MNSLQWMCVPGKLSANNSRTQTPLICILCAFNNQGRHSVPYNAWLIISTKPKSQENAQFDISYLLCLYICLLLRFRWDLFWWVSHGCGWGMTEGASGGQQRYWDVEVSPSPLYNPIESTSLPLGNGTTFPLYMPISPLRFSSRDCCLRMPVHGT